MAKRKRSEHLESLRAVLHEDRKTPHRKFPDLAVHAIEEDRVAAAIEKRLGAKSGLTNIRQLDYNFHSGLHYIVFEFSPLTESPGKATALLVLLTGDCKVVGVVDPFDPVQPNKFVPPLPSEGDQPFVLDRPSGAKQVKFSDEALYPLQVRSREFLERLRVGGGGIIIDINTYTWCTFKTWTPYGSVLDTILDDCGPDPFIIA